MPLLKKNFIYLWMRKEAFSHVFIYSTTITIVDCKAIYKINVVVVVVLFFCIFFSKCCTIARDKKKYGFKHLYLWCIRRRFTGLFTESAKEGASDLVHCITVETKQRKNILFSTYFSLFSNIIIGLHTYLRQLLIRQWTMKNDSFHKDDKSLLCKTAIIKLC